LNHSTCYPGIAISLEHSKTTSVIMGQANVVLQEEVQFVKSLLMDERGCWSAMMLPKKAPEWYRRLVAGHNEQDVHQQPAPSGSLFLLGHVTLAVPDADEAHLFYAKGLGMDEDQGDQELRFSAGPSQIRASLRPDQDPERWPGELRVWVEDMRETTDMLNIMNHQLNQLLLDEMLESQSGGEYAIRLKDPSRTNFVLVSEAPEGFPEQIRAIPAAEGLAVSNVVSLSAAVVRLKNRTQMASAANFYEKILGAAVTRKYAVYERQAQVDSFLLHFSPGDGLHQTMSFEVDASAQLTNLGSVCFYVQDWHGFRLAFAKAKAAGFLAGPEAWTEVAKAFEFRLSGVADPSSKVQVLPMEHVIRHTDHPECPLQTRKRLEAQANDFATPSLKAVTGGA